MRRPPRLLARVAAALPALLVAGAAGAQGVSYDFTRTWTQCTRGAVSACAALSVRTLDLPGGGSRVFLGLTNLQGSTPLDNSGGSLLFSAYFGTGGTAAAGSARSLAGVGEDGATGTTQAWQESDNGASLSVSTAASGGYTTRNVPYTLGYYYGYSTSHWDGSYYWYDDIGYNSYQTSTTAYDYTSTQRGIAGRNAAGGSTTSASSNSVYAPTQSYTTRQWCNWGCWTVYRPTSGASTVVATYQTYTTYARVADGSTPDAGAAVWYQFDSPTAYDVRTFTVAQFGVQVSSTGTTRYCASTDTTNCSLVSDVLVNNTPPVVTPEPASLALLGAGVLGLAGVVARRRRPPV